eukprot:CAMPEP_0181330944 /NCGR_PEP_ID=MMETSP1101-20121128/24208_1 /TAXON_ID=46948 /ORGANISM="Rhodomonas abbreviata, Strain Caron Lab Isolate" /LENGTH=34 /DNA_ID= /DNA_START= /DNA_END= /DNA_ORIENTATION=
MSWNSISASRFAKSKLRTRIHASAQPPSSTDTAT